MNTNTLFTLVRGHFGGGRANPYYTDDLLCVYLNDYISNTLANLIKLEKTTTRDQALTAQIGEPANLQDWTLVLGPDVRRVLRVTWQPSGGSPAHLTQSSEDLINGLGDDPYTTVGTPIKYWIDHGLVTGQDAATMLLHPYPIQSGAGTLAARCVVAPTAAAVDNPIPFPDLFAKAAEWDLVARWRDNEEEYTDQDRTLAEAERDRKQDEALGKYEHIVGPTVLKSRSTMFRKG